MLPLTDYRTRRLWNWQMMALTDDGIAKLYWRMMAQDCGDTNVCIANYTMLLLLPPQCRLWHRQTMELADIGLAIGYIISGEDKI